MPRNPVGRTPTDARVIGRESERKIRRGVMAEFHTLNGRADPNRKSCY